MHHRASRIRIGIATRLWRIGTHIIRIYIIRTATRIETRSLDMNAIFGVRRIRAV